MQRIGAATRVNDLVKEYPFIIDFLAARNTRFGLLRSKVARATVGRMATLGKVATIGGEELPALLDAIAEEIERQTGERPAVDASSVEEAPDEQERVAAMKEIIKGLHEGMPFEEAKEAFDKLIADVAPDQIAQMEQQLIREGMPVEEVTRLCDLHVGVFKSGLDEHELPELPPGHPVHTYLADNRMIAELAGRLGEMVANVESGAQLDGGIREEAAELLERLSAVDNHYVRKENQLFPFLEKHGVTGPSQVMWGVHDAIRKLLKLTYDALDAGDAAGFTKHGARLARNLTEMIYKENKILLPLALEKLSDAEWAEIRRGEDELGYALEKPAADWPPEGFAPEAAHAAEDLLSLSTGGLTREQIDLLLRHLPVDITFVDEDDTVRYYSDSSHRIFPRSPAIIGRKVQNCHPPKSLGQVQSILDAFRKGEKDTAEFWIQLKGRFLHIRYFAVRDRQGAYRGCLEVSQDITGLRALEGERRLLDWE
ncbi:MAG: DUF438 domain-containing protein [Deltaproteobacteria bacterium]|nr:MAG: DUF438 domain-containing protein [Deltaproteobacteria bacterium]